MDNKNAKEYSKLISEITGVKSSRSGEELALLYESGKHDELDLLDLSQYSGWLASAGNFDQAEHIAKLILDDLIQQQTLTLVAQRMIERGILERPKILLDLMRTEPTYNGRAQVNARVQPAEAYYKQGSAELATAILNEVEEFDKPESLTDFERAD